MLDKIKSFFRRIGAFAREKPILFVAIGGAVIFALYLIVRALRGRGQAQVPGITVAGHDPVAQTLPAFVPPAPGIDEHIGEYPDWEADAALGARFNLDHLRRMQTVLIEQFRDIQPVEMVIERFIERAPAAVAPAAVTPAAVAPAPVVAPAPARAPVVTAVRAPEMDIVAQAVQRAQAVRYEDEGAFQQAMRQAAAAARAIAPAVTPAVTPAHAPSVTPAVDVGLVQRLRADIARVEGLRGDAGFAQRMAAQWGSVEQYLAAQRQRLQTALRGG